ncbi:monofunctional biosynthetic peptidoglycan transglycosylase [Caulobacter sp. RL271]|uniref:Biosynthetic peptidoglycan transglycosylase n=1 Tax=Caulobacter segnis TaxID=88688 RepID=A0ABY4ZSI9_9CAUL|nr:monofunctional biosynthetic peptidoglycan transglycosylase [Caulobacter segnis]USQ95599.1 monofunctional biosynthetic peptidoglycan transglycosylase [Caulobacter segnis]
MRRLLRNIALALFIVLVAGPVAMVILYRFIPPPVTPLMVIRAVEGRGLDHRWRPIDQVSPALPRALIAAEDAKFCDHRGFDFDALYKAYENNESGKKVRGGSTISQQTAKNVFLWPGRSYVRKGLEAWFTVLIETFWGKKRIMEVYLNSIEYGSGIYGAEAASQRYFGVGADRLSQAQASRLAAILPSPLKWQVVKPGKYVAKRSKKIGKASGAVRRDGLADCVG